MNNIHILQPKIFPGRLFPKDNRNAIDWHWQNLVAYANHSHLVIADPNQLQILQTLCEHKFNITSVKWSNDLLNKELTEYMGTDSSNSANDSNIGGNNNNHIRIASGDSGGNILIWNALEGIVVNYLVPSDKGTNPVVDLSWHPDDPTQLLALHSHHLTCWSTSSSAPLWRRSIIEFSPARSIHFDPFPTTSTYLNQHSLYVSTSFGVILGSDELGGALEFKARIQSSKSSGQILSLDSNLASNQWSIYNGGLININNSTSGTNTGNLAPSGNTLSDSKSFEKSSIPGDFVQMALSPTIKNLIYYVLTREIFIYDTITNQQFGSLQLDRNKANFQHIIIGKDNPNIMFSLHDDGSITTWIRKPEGFNTHNYEQLTSSDLSHFQKKSKKKGLSIISICNSPFFEQTLISITGDGIVWKWDFISELTSNSSFYSARLLPLTTTPLNGVIKLAISGLIEGVSSPITSLSVYPFFNKAMVCLLAIGTSNGTIQVINLSTMRVQKEIFIWNHPVFGIKWLSPGRVVCHSYEEQEKGSYLNFIGTVDFRSGRIKEFRKVSGTEPSFIRGIRLSYSRRFLVLLMKDRPFELWETKKFTCLRSFKPFTHIIGLEWLPPSTDSEVELSADSSKYEAREQFNFLLQDGVTKSCIIESSSVTLQDVPADLGSQTQSCLAFKGDFLVSGDVSGTLHSWNLVKKKLNSISTHRGPIKKIRFNPDPNSQEILVLFASGEIGIWDLSGNTRVALSNYLMEREIKAIDIEWAQSSHPVIVSSDHCIRVLDSTLSVTNSRYHYPMNTSAPPSETGNFLQSPLLLPHNRSLQLYHLLLNYKHSKKIDPLLNKSSETSFQISEQLELNNKLLGLVDEKLLESLESNSICESSLIVAQYFGDYKEIEFWRIAINSIQRCKFNKSKKLLEPSNLPFYNDELVSIYNSLPSIKFENPNSSINNINPNASTAGININQSSNTIPINTNVNTNVTATLATSPSTSGLNNVTSNTTNLNSSTQTMQPQPQTTTSSLTSSLLKKASFFSFGLQKSTNQAPTTATPNTSITQPVITSPPVTPTKTTPNSQSLTSSTLGTNSNTNTPSISNFTSPISNLTSPIQLSTSTQVNPLSISQSFTSVASQLQSLGESIDGISPSGSNTPSLFSSLNDSSNLNRSSIFDTNPNSNLVSTLPSYYDMYLDSNVYRNIELEKTDYHEKKKPDTELSKKLIERNIILGRNMRAINLLLDTTPDNPDFYNRALKASVISASISAEHYQSTTKLIAENLIAVGKVDEGIQFLCMIGKTLEACKYLQSCDRWNDAAKLAKINLAEDEQHVVFRSWVIHLLNTHTKLSQLPNTVSNSSTSSTSPNKTLTKPCQMALSILLSLGDFRNVIQLLYELQHYDLASLLILTCIENSIFSENLDETFVSTDIISLESDYQSNNPFSFKQLSQIIFKEYGNMLHQYGNYQPSEYYWSKSGKKSTSSQ